MAFIRAKQPIITRLFPHNGNRTHIIPRRRPNPAPLGYDIAWDQDSYAFGETGTILVTNALPIPFLWEVRINDTVIASPVVIRDGTSNAPTGNFSITNIEFAGNFAVGTITADFFWDGTKGFRGLSVGAHTEWTN